MDQDSLQKSKKIKFNQKISIGLQKLGDKRLGKSVEEDLRNALLFEAKKSSHLIYLDTAEIYGLNKSEIVIGEIINIVGRNKFHISTKIGLNYIIDSKGKVKSYRYFDDYSINAAFDKVFKRLNCVPNRIYLHWPHPTDIKKTISCLKNMVRKCNENGIKEVGICNISNLDYSINLKMLRDIGISVIQERINLLDRKTPLIKEARKFNFKVVSHSTFSQGILLSSEKINLKKRQINERYNLKLKVEEVDSINQLKTFLDKISSQLKSSHIDIIIGCQKKILGNNSEIIIGVQNKEHIVPIFGSLQEANVDEEIYNQILQKIDDFVLSSRTPNH